MVCKNSPSDSVSWEFTHERLLHKFFENLSSVLTNVRQID